MKEADNMKKLIKKLRFEATADTHEKILGKVLEALDESRKQKSDAIAPNILRKIVKTKLTRKVAVLCCVAMVSVAAATVGPSVYRKVQSFLSALVGKRTQELVTMADPMSAVPSQIAEAIDELGIGSEFKLVSLLTDNDHALAVTTDVVGDHDRQGPLVITLVKRDNEWLVTDIDLETEATAKDEINRFLNKHPNAVEIPLR